MAKGDDLFLVGGGQLGALYAVYDFVEDNLGFRHYFWREDGFVVDKVSSVVWKGKPSRNKPAFDGYRMDHHQSQPEALFEVRNHGNARIIEQLIPGYRAPYAPRVGGHGFNPNFIPPDDPPAIFAIPKEIKIKGYFKEHPEWFSLTKEGKRVPDQQVCLSNPGCRQKLFDNLLQWVKLNGAGNYMIASNDNHNDRYCWCDGCVALEKIAREKNRFAMPPR